MEVFGKTDVGKVRDSNQDTYCCGKLSDTVLYAVVCDGMGGASGGNVASEIAAKILAQRITAQYRDHMPQASVLNMLESAMDAANVDVFDRAATDAALYGMGTTLVAVIVDGTQVYSAHVGDSRLYALTKNGFRQITTDHSVVQEMIEKGQLTAEQARSHPRKHFITRAIGVEGNVRCDFDTFTIENNDRLLLCTDGLTNMLPDDTIGRFLQNGNPADLPDTLIQAANDAGGEDNITAVILA